MVAALVTCRFNHHGEAPAASPRRHLMSDVRDHVESHTVRAAKFVTYCADSWCRDSVSSAGAGRAGRIVRRRRV